MDERHPKRRKDKNNPYTLSVASGKFYLSFRDGMGVLHEMEIDSELYGLFNSFELEDLSYLNEWGRHIEQSELPERICHYRDIRRLFSFCKQLNAICLMIILNKFRKAKWFSEKYLAFMF